MRFTERANDMRKQMESRWRQLDRFEASVKAIAEAKSTWRKKMSAKEGEIEALKVCELSHWIKFDVKPHDGVRRRQMVNCYHN